MIPDSALDDRLGIVGTAGSGKTYGAGTAVERILARKGRCIIPDPLGVWWGLRLRADGVTPSPFDVVIFGGPHGDLPLNEHAGALIGETVAGMKESAIVDLSELGTKAAERKFMLAFLTALYRRASGDPVHLIFDEADMWSPQRLMDREGDAAKLLGMMETIVRRGRIKGFIPWLITQRPAVVNKDVLSQVDGLVAFKLTSSHDRDALGAWVEGQADAGQWKSIYAALPTKARGEAVIWLPGHGVLRNATFPLKLTFDSSRTPKRGEKRQAAELTPIDLGALKQRLATVEAETKANDPRLLRAEIARLQGEMRKAQAAGGGASAEEVDQAHAEGYQSGLREGLRRMTVGYEPRLMAMDGGLKQLATAIEDFKRVCERAATEMPPAPVAKPTVTITPRQRIPVPAIVANGTGEDRLPATLQRAVNAIAWWRQIGQEPVDRSRACVVAGYSPRASTFGVYIAELTKRGLVEVSPGKLKLTSEGLRLAIVPPGDTREQLFETAAGMLSAQERRVFEAIYRHWPQEVSRKVLADEVGLSPTASTLGVYIAGVSAYGIVETSSPGHVRAAEWLFP